MTGAIQLQPVQATTPPPTVSYDLFSKDSDACCAKLESESVDVFEDDESTTEVTVSWSNGTVMPCPQVLTYYGLSVFCHGALLTAFLSRRRSNTRIVNLYRCHISLAATRRNWKCQAENNVSGPPFLSRICVLQSSETKKKKS